jgi:hypothetical protein
MMSVILQCVPIQSEPSVAVNSVVVGPGRAASCLDAPRPASALPAPRARDTSAPLPFLSLHPAYSYQAR